MVARIATFNKRRYNSYVPAAGYAADVIHAGPLEVDFGTPAVSAADNILNDQSIASASSTTTLLDDQADANYGRNVRVVASGAATSTVTVKGRDYLGQPMSETLTLNGTNSVVGVKAFYWLDSVSWTATAATTIDLGWGARFGLPYRTVNAVAEQADGVAAAAGTLTAGVRTDPQTATTADPRGLYTPTTTPDGSKRLVAIVLTDNFVNSSGNGGLHGIAHYSA
jgi:hypothetical protein